MSSSLDVVFFDFETTDLLMPKCAPLDKQPRIIEYCFLRRDGDNITSLVNPQQKLRQIITNITGLNDSHLREEKSIEYHLDRISEFIEGADRVVAHNAMFDVEVLNHEFARYNRKPPWPPLIQCTVEDTEHIRGYRLTMGNLYKHCFGEEFQNAHRALPDTDALRRCWEKLYSEGEI